MSIPLVTRSKLTIAQNQPLLLAKESALNPPLPPEVTKACLELLAEVLRVVVQNETKNNSHEREDPSQSS